MQLDMNRKQSKFIDFINIPNLLSKPMNMVKGLQRVSCLQWGVWDLQGWRNVSTVPPDRELRILLRFHDQQMIS